MGMTPQPIDQPHRPAWAPVLLVLITLGVFGSLVSAEFSFYDDNYNLFQNPRMNPPTWESVRYYWTHQEQGLYVPLTYTVWCALAWIGRVSPDPMGIALNPWLFHSANIVIHVLSALAVYALLLRLFEKPHAAFIGALFYAIHPVQVEPVAWAAGLKDVLAGMLGMVALWQYAEWARGSGQWSVAGGQSRAGKYGYAIGLAAFVLAMLAKPSALVIPFVAGLIDVGLVNRKLKDVIRSLWPWFILSLICAWVGSHAQPAIGVTPAPLWARPLVMLDALAFYLYKLVWPLSLGLDYGRKPAYVMGQWWFYVTWIVPISLMMLLAMNRTRCRELGVAAAVFVVGVAPVLGLVTFLFQFRSTTADHYLYIAMLGPAIAAAWFIRKWGRGPVMVGSLVVLILLATMSFLQCQVWADDLKLFEHALKLNPRSVMSMHNLAHAHAIRGRPAMAVPLLEKAIEGDPTYSESYEYLASVLKGMNRLSDSIAYRLKAIELVEARPPELQKWLSSHYVSVASDLIDAGRREEARRLLDKAIQRGPENDEAAANLRAVEERWKSPATAQSSGAG